MKYIKLLVLSSTYPRWSEDHEPGFVHELARRLTDMCDVTVLCPHADGAQYKEILDGVQVIRYRYAPTFLETLIYGGGIVSNLRKTPWKWLLVPGFLMAQLFHTWNTIRTVRPDIVHAHWLIPQGASIALLSLIDKRTPPFLITSHGADLFALRGKALQAIKRFVGRRAAALTVVSSAMREECVRLGIETHNTYVLPMGVDLENRFCCDPVSVRSENEILFVGRLVKKKGLDWLLKAMPAILAAHPTAFLSVAGFGPEEETLKQQTIRLGLQGKVRFLGPLKQTELPVLYRRAAVFVAPFVQTKNGDVEGLGLVTAEALGCGCPVIVGNVPAAHDLIPSESQWIVSPQETDKLASAILGVLRNPEVAAVTAAQLREAVRQKVSWSSVAMKYKALFFSIATKTIAPESENVPRSHL